MTNQKVLRVFGSVLIIAGPGGFVVSPGLASRGAKPAAAFNVVIGLLLVVVALV